MTVMVGDILRVVATYTWADGNIMQNVFNAVIGSGGGPFTDGDIVDDAEAWMDNCYANITARVTSDVDGSQIQVYKYDSIDDDWDEVGTTSWTWNPSGGATGYLARGVAGLVTARTSNPDVQGKKYVGGLLQANVINGLLQGALLTDLLAFAADWITDFVGGTSGANWEPGVWSPTDTALYQMATSISASGIPSYQRRRKRGVGA